MRVRAKDLFASFLAGSLFASGTLASAAGAQSDIDAGLDADERRDGALPSADFFELLGELATDISLSESGAGSGSAKRQHQSARGKTASGATWIDILDIVFQDSEAAETIRVAEKASLVEVKNHDHIQ